MTFKCATRAVSSTIHPNKLGYFLVLTTLLSLGQLLSIKKSDIVFQLAWCAIIAVQVLGIYYSGSVTAYLGVFLGVVVFAYISRFALARVTKPFRIVAMIVLFTSLIVIIRLIVADGLPTFNKIMIAQAFIRVQTSTAESRLTTYSQALDQIARNPWFGVGYDQISTSNIAKESRILDFSVHNVLLQIWYTGGLLAFVGWFAIYTCVGWMAIELIRNVKHNSYSPIIMSLASCALAILLMDQFQDSIYEREKWLVIGLLSTAVWERIEINKIFSTGGNQSQ